MIIKQILSAIMMILMSAACVRAASPVYYDGSRIYTASGGVDVVLGTGIATNNPIIPSGEIGSNYASLIAGNTFAGGAAQVMDRLSTTNLTLPLSITPSAPASGVTLWSDYTSVTSSVEKLLLHFDGTNNSITIIDDSSVPKTVTCVNDTKLVTGTNKFGTAACLFDGAGDYLTTASSSDFDLADENWTIEFWVYHTTSFLSSQYYCGMRRGDTGDTISYCLAIAKDYLYSGSCLYMHVFDTAHNEIVQFSSPTALLLNQWYHCAWVRSNSTWTIYLNGTGTSSTASGTIDYDSGAFRIGQSLGGFGSGINEQFAGIMDDFRFTKGIAKYSSDFTPPAAPLILAITTNTVLRAINPSGVVSNVISW